MCVASGVAVTVGLGVALVAVAVAVGVFIALVFSVVPPQAVRVSASAARVRGAIFFKVHSIVFICNLSPIL